MHHPTDRIAYTTAFVTPVVEHWLEREIAQWVHPMKDQSDDSSHHERTLLPRSYISLPEENGLIICGVRPSIPAYLAARRNMTRSSSMTLCGCHLRSSCLAHSSGICAGPTLGLYSGSRACGMKERMNE